MIYILHLVLHTEHSSCLPPFAVLQGILFPLVGPLAWNMGAGNLNILIHCFACILGGAIFGNTFSPIADTSILTVRLSQYFGLLQCCFSSDSPTPIMQVLAARMPLADHVATAGPYAILVGLVSLIIGDVGMGLGLYGPFAALGLVIATQTAFLGWFGRKYN